ncbi:hypothetical protein ACFL6I_25425 [candidate division KSB1 bacterium]
MGNDHSDLYSGEKEHDQISLMIDYYGKFKGKKNTNLISASLWQLDGLDYYRINYLKETRITGLLFAEFHSLSRNRINDFDYLLYPEYWGGGVGYKSSNNTFIQAGIKKKVSKETHCIEYMLIITSSIFTRSYDYGSLRTHLIHEYFFSKLVLRSRIFAQYGYGKSWPFESVLYLSDNDKASFMADGFTRARGFIPQTCLGYGLISRHFQYGGGLNLRGYSGYIASDVNEDGTIIPVYYGKSGAAVNMELEFNKIFQSQNPNHDHFFNVKTYLFSDIGVINSNEFDNKLLFSKIRIDAGIGMALNIQQWGLFDRIKPLTVRIDFPLFLNRPPAIEPNYFNFRWIFGLKRAF